jgi:soluble lytic murein transglycosylase-like protein
MLSVPLRHVLGNEQFSQIEFSSISDNDIPACVQMYNSIEKHSKKYGIPLRYALGVAYVETGYAGPLQWNYKPNLVSPAGALGPMQIMPGTANLMWDNKKIPHDKILNDIDFNVETSMKLLSKLHKKYGDWKTVFGCYNTGKPCINSYSEKVFNFKTNNI